MCVCVLCVLLLLLLLFFLPFHCQLWKRNDSLSARRSSVLWEVPIYSSQLNFWSTESIFNQFSVFLKTFNALCVCLQYNYPRSMKRVIRSDKPVTLLLLFWSHKCDFGAEPRSRIIATSAVKGLMKDCWLELTWTLQTLYLTGGGLTGVSCVAEHSSTSAQTTVAVTVHNNTHATVSLPPVTNAGKWSSYDRIWFSGPDKQEIFILILILMLVSLFLVISPGID
jgi:hypothetical protein